MKIMIRIKKIKPLFTALVTTMDKYEADVINDGGLIDPSKTKGSLKQFQKVIAVGQNVMQVKVGDLVAINPIRYAEKKHKEGSLKDGIITDNPVITYNIPTIEIDGKECLFLDDRDISYVVEDYDIIADNTTQELQKAALVDSIIPKIKQVKKRLK